MESHDVDNDSQGQPNAVAEPGDDDQHNEHNRPKLICTATRYPPSQETASQNSFQQGIDCGEPFRDCQIIQRTAGLAGKNGDKNIGSVGPQFTHSRLGKWQKLTIEAVPK